MSRRSMPACCADSIWNFETYRLDIVLRFNIFDIDIFKYQRFDIFNINVSIYGSEAVLVGRYCHVKLSKIVKIFSSMVFQYNMDF